jgi:hypothetical protein
MLKYIFAFVLLLASSLAFGQVTSKNLGDFDNLNDLQRAEILGQIAKMKNQAAQAQAAAQKAAETPAKAVQQVVEKSTPEQLVGWAQVGAALGKGLAQTARELGIAANEFVQTPVGKLTAGIILWKYMGASLVHLIVGSIFLVVYFLVWLYLIRRFGLITSITKEPVVLIEAANIVGTRTITKYCNWREQEGSYIVVALLTAAAGIAVGMTTIFNGLE